MGLVREYDGVWGLLALIPGVREHPPPAHTHTHVTARLQAPHLSISENKHNTHAQQYDSTCAHIRTPVNVQDRAQVEKHAYIIVSARARARA